MINTITSNILTKSQDKSKLTRVPFDSYAAANFFNEEEPYRLIREKAKNKPRGVNLRKKIPVKVIQVMSCADNHFLIEYIDVVDIPERYIPQF